MSLPALVEKNLAHPWTSHAYEHSKMNGCYMLIQMMITLVSFLTIFTCVLPRMLIEIVDFVFLNVIKSQFMFCTFELLER